MKKNYLTKKSPSTSNNITVKTTTLFKAVIVFCLFVFNSSFGQGATCATATPINVNQNYTTFVINDNTVNDPTPAACNGQNPVRDGWFSFIANGTEAKVFATATNRNPILYAYSGTCGSLNFLNCSNIL